jgi:hypothetical protein
MIQKMSGTTTQAYNFGTNKYTKLSIPLDKWNVYEGSS